MQDGDERGTRWLAEFGVALPTSHQKELRHRSQKTDGLAKLEMRGLAAADLEMLSTLYLAQLWIRYTLKGQGPSLVVWEIVGAKEEGDCMN